METKANPSSNSCYAKAMPHEPMFTLLGRDIDAPATIRAWAQLRLESCSPGSTEMEQVEEALATANAFEQWRNENFGAWKDYRGGKPDLLPTPTDEISSIAGRINGSRPSGDEKFNELLADAKRLAGFVMRSDRQAGPNSNG